MTSPAQPDLSKLRINRDAPPPGLSRAVRRNAILGVVALILVIGAFLGWRRGSVVAVETVVAKPFDAGGSADNAGSSSVTANGYVVARTRASVSAKLPGRIAELRVSEGSTLKKDEIIATLENADYQAQLAQAQAAEATARADLMEARASLATASRDAKRLRDIRTQDSKAVAEQDFDAALRFMDAARPGQPLYVVGHSIGGYLPGLSPMAKRIDRMLTQLSQAGILGKVSGVVFGQCTGCGAREPSYGGFTLSEVLQQHFGPLGVPAFQGAAIGHVASQFSLPLGVRAEIDADAGSIRLLEAAVS